MIAILQVLGDPKQYKELNYVLEGKRYKEKFLSFAIREWLNDGDVIFLVPDSLVTRIGESCDEIYELLKDEKKLATRIADMFDEEVDCIVLPSVGVYTANNCTVQFKGSIENTIVRIFKELIKRDVKEIFADVSTGQNIYTTAMVEALRKYVTYKKLGNLLQGEESVSVKIAYVPPVVVKDQEIHVELHDLNVKAFFDLPKCNPRNLSRDGKVNGEVCKKYNEFLRNLSHTLSNLKVAFNSIKYNTPLVLYQPESVNLDLDDDINMKVRKYIEVIEDLENRKSVTFNDGVIEVKRFAMVERDITNTFFALALMSSIIRFVKDNIREPELDEIFATFKNLYNNLKLELNTKFLDRDIRNIKRVAKDLTGEKLLSELYKDYDVEEFEEKGKEDEKESDQERNFFAHSGFLREITRIRKEGEKIYVRYDLDEMKRKSIKIRKWLEDK